MTPMSEKEKECYLSWDASEETCSVSECVGKQDEPLLAWAEPRAGYMRNGNKGRIEDFRAMVLGKPAWPADVPLVEARLFYADRAIHVVASGDQSCRQVVMKETDAGDQENKVRKRDKRVLPLCDWKRFGFAADDKRFEIEWLRAIEYLQDGRLAGWRLIIDRGEEHA